MPTISGTVYDHTGAAAAGRIVRAYRRDTGVLLGQATTGNGIGTPGDSSFANVNLLLSFDGPNDSTSIADKSSAGKTVSVAGAAKISTAQSRFGGSSLLLDGSSAYLQVANGGSFDFGSGDFTVEFWVRRNRSDTEEVVLSLGPLGQSTAFAPLLIVRFNSTGTLQAYVNVSSTGSSVFGNCVSSTTYGISTSLLHVAYVRSGSSFGLYVDGVLVSSAASSSTQGVDAAALLFIGRDCRTNPFYFSGYIDEMRITKGVARYTAGFAPPSDAFADSLGVPAVAVGTYSIDSGAYSGQCNVIALDDDAGTVYNDLIKRVTPA